MECVYIYSNLSIYFCINNCENINFEICGNIEEYILKLNNIKLLRYLNINFLNKNGKIYIKNSDDVLNCYFLSGIGEYEYIKFEENLYIKKIIDIIEINGDKKFNLKIEKIKYYIKLDYRNVNDLNNYINDFLKRISNYVLFKKKENELFKINYYYNLIREND